MIDEGDKMIDHPAHYESNGIEAIDVIDAFNLDFSAGNAVKYILRAGRKQGNSAIEDLRKARWYIDHIIGKFELDNN